MFITTNFFSSLFKSKNTKQTIRLATALVAMILLGVLEEGEKASAAILNSDFNQGLEHWETLGAVSVRNGGNYAQIQPNLNNKQAILHTGNGAVDADDIWQFTLGSSYSGQDIGVEGSAIQQTFSLEEGEKFSFNWNFIVDPEDSNNDFASITILGKRLGTSSTSSWNPVFVDAQSNLLFNSIDPNGSFIRETGSQYFEYTAPFAGEYTLTFNVMDRGDATGVSYLVVDKPVPEPITGLVVAAGLGGAALKRTKDKAKKS